MGAFQPLHRQYCRDIRLDPGDIAARQLLWDLVKTKWRLGGTECLGRCVRRSRCRGGVPGKFGNRKRGGAGAGDLERDLSQRHTVGQSLVSHCLICRLFPSIASEPAQDSGYLLFGWIITNTITPSKAASRIEPKRTRSSLIAPKP